MIVGRAVGAGVDFPDRYVGSKVGVAVGLAVGAAVGAGVDFPGKYVGSKVGVAVGNAVGYALGDGVAIGISPLVVVTPELQL